MKLKPKPYYGPWPDKKDIEEVLKTLDDPNRGHHMLPPNANTADRAKYALSQLIIAYKRESGLKQRELAEILGIDESRMSEILRGKIQSFSLDRMIGYAEKLLPGLKVEFSAA